MPKLGIFLVLFFLYILQGAFSSPIFGQVSETRTITLTELGYPLDQTVQGVRAAQEYNFPFPDGWEIPDEMWFTLDFGHSPALGALSTIATDWNGTRLASTLLTPENAQTGKLDIRIPGDLIHKGFNSLRLEFYMGIRENFCTDLDNPSVWATIHATSAFRLQVQAQSAVPDLATLPRPFIDNSGLITNTLTFALPPQPTTAELTAVSAVSARFGNLAAWRTLELDAIQVDAATRSANLTNRIILGTADRLLDAGVTLPFATLENGIAVLRDAQGQPIPDGAGVLFERNVSGTTNLLELVVTGATEDGVLNAARALATPSTYPRFSGTMGVILDVPRPAPNAQDIGQFITFEQLGYTDQAAEGSRQQTLNYILPLPLSWQVQTGAVLDLHFAHSELLDAQYSSLNVLLNNVPVGSILLNSGNSSDAHTTFTLPSRLFKVGDNNLALVANIQIGKDLKDEGECLNDYFREAWLVVYADSQLNLPSTPASIALTLDNYPRAFVGAANLADLGLVLPPTSDAALARALAQVIGRLGRFADGDTLYPQVISAAASEDTQTFPYQFLFGEPVQNTALGALNAQLPLPFQPGTNIPQPTALVANILPPNGSVGYIQATATTDSMPRLVITGNDARGVKWSANTLSTADGLAALEGDLAIVSGIGLIATADIRTITIQPAGPAAIPSVLPTETPTPWWLYAATAGVFLLSGVILGGVAWQSSRRRTGRSLNA